MVKLLVVFSVPVSVDVVLWWISGDGMVDLVVAVGTDCCFLQYVVLEWLTFCCVVSLVLVV